MICPVCGRTVASGSHDSKKPNWATCNGGEPRKMATRVKKYHVSFQTNEDSVSLGEFDFKKDALEFARQHLDGGMSYKDTWSYANRPSVAVYNQHTDELVYNRPLFKRALKQ